MVKTFKFKEKYYSSEVEPFFTATQKANLFYESEQTYTPKRTFKLRLSIIKYLNHKKNVTAKS